MMRNVIHASRLMIVVVALGVGLAAQTQPAAQPKIKVPASPVKNNDDSQLYRNSTFGFRYQIPYGWVDRTKNMRGEIEVGKGEVLLAAFERPPEATGETVNSTVMIASESAASYPGLKRAEDFLGPLTELATSEGFKASGEPYALDVESRQLVRADFVKQISDKLTMHQCTLVLLTKGQIVSFMFIAGSEDELDEIMDGLHFGAAKTSAAR
jgi:hypothetical protein